MNNGSHSGNWWNVLIVLNIAAKVKIYFCEKLAFDERNKIKMKKNSKNKLRSVKTCKSFLNIQCFLVSLFLSLAHSLCRSVRVYFLNSFSIVIFHHFFLFSFAINSIPFKRGIKNKLLCVFRVFSFFILFLLLLFLPTFSYMLKTKNKKE